MPVSRSQKKSLKVLLLQQDAGQTHRGRLMDAHRESKKKVSKIKEFAALPPASRKRTDVIGYDDGMALKKVRKTERLYKKSEHRPRSPVLP